MGRVSFAQFADTEQIDTIVTDQIEAKDQLLIEHAGIALVVTSGQH
jgi:DeoR/GlpR family transcriptional regulator of sugar metabolism